MEKRNYNVTLPAWAITIIFMVILSIIGFSFANGKTNQKVNALEIAVEKKANQSEVDRIYVILDRIDSKMDKLILGK